LPEDPPAGVAERRGRWPIRGRVPVLIRARAWSWVRNFIRPLYAARDDHHAAFSAIGVSAPLDNVVLNHEAIVGPICVMRTTPRLPDFGTSGPRMMSDAWSSGRVGANPCPPRELDFMSSTSCPAPV